MNAWIPILGTVFVAIVHELGMWLRARPHEHKQAARAKHSERIRRRLYKEPPIAGAPRS